MIFPIFLAVLSWLTVNLQFHLDKQLTLCCMKGIKRIVAMQNNKISVEANVPAVTILNGANFSNLVSEITDDTSSQILVTANGVFFSDGSKIIQKTIQNKTNVTFVQDYWGNILLTDKYALFTGVSQFPILNKINFSSMVIQIYEYNSTQFPFSYPGCLSDLKNGQIIFGQRYSVYILDNQTLEVEQVFTQTEPYQNTDFQSIVSSWNASSNQAVILIQGFVGQYQTYKLNQITKKFEFRSRFINPTSEMTLTSPTTAVSIRQGKLLYWQNFDEQVVAHTQNATEYYLSYAQKIIVSNSEDLMVIWNDDSSITFATMLQDYSIFSNFTVQPTSTGTVIDAQFTKDDSFLFYILSERFTDDLQFHITDIQAKEQRILVDENGTNINPQAFLLLETYLIILTFRGLDNSSYFLELRNATDKAVPIISQLIIYVDMTSLGFKLLGNEYWNSIFILLIQTSVYFDSVALQFFIKDGQISMLPIQNKNISFTNSFACQQYLINIPISYKDFYVYFPSNMSLVKKISNQFGCNSYYSKQHIFIAQYQNASLYESGSFIYDFSQTKQNWEAGLFYREYERDFEAKRVIYSKRKLYFIAYDSVFGQIGKIIYDLNKIPIKKMSPLEAEGYSIPSNTFKIMSSDTANSSCLWIFMIKNYGLLKHDECQPLNPQTVNISQISNKQLFMSSNKKYIIFSYTKGLIQQQPYILEVRETNNINNLVKTVTIYMDLSVSGADITNDQKIIVNLFNNRILIFDMEIQQNINSIDLTSIDLYDVSLNGIIAMTGYSSLDSTTPVLAVKKFGQSSFLLITNLTSSAKMLKISPLGSNIAVWDANSLLIWAVLNQSIIFEMAQVDVIDLKFVQQKTVFLQFAQSVSIISFDQSELLSNNQLGSSASTTAVNNNGTLIAMIVGPQTMKIYNKSMAQITTFSAPLQSIIVGISFSADDQLYAATSDNTLYVVSPTPCPANFINVDSICLCPQNLTNSTGICACRQNFTPNNDTCLCENGFTYDGLNCFCNSNATIIEAACACKQNFVLQNGGCLCTNGFTFDSGNCFCNSQATIIEGICTCNNGFIFQNSTGKAECICQDGYIEESLCKQCSFLCASCDGSGLSCTSFSVIFYVSIGVITVLLISLVVLIRYLIKKKKQKDVSLIEDNQAQTKSDKSNNENYLQVKLRNEDEDEKNP